MTGDSYAAGVREFRRRKDAHFAAGRGPLRGDRLIGFSGLSYFPVQESWRLFTGLELSPGNLGAGVPLETTTGEPRVMARLGRLALTLPGGAGVRLSAFAPLGEERPARLFIPLRDGTSGRETYPAGRYLDAPVTWHSDDEATAEVDFNFAYHPYCAYAEGWTCPLPPPENWLDLRVEAGERL